MKKMLSLLLALCMILALCACEAKTEEPEAAAEAVEPAVEEATEAPASEEPASAEPAQATIQPAIAPEDQPVADHAEAIALELSEDEHFLAFAGDQHAEGAGFRIWLEDQLAVYGDQLELLSYSGDICDKNWEQATFDTFKATLDELVPGRYTVTTGNQEWKSGAPGANFADLGEGFICNGEVVSTDYYCVYNFGATAENMNFSQEQIDALAAYLASAPADKPIFVASHFPLHLVCATADHSIPGGDHRSSENAGAVIELLNQYPNVIYLWGHNHSLADPRYGTICPAGSAMTYDYNNPTDKITINFAYVNYGSFCRGDSYGLVADVMPVDGGIQVKLDYVDTNVPMETKDRAVMTFVADGTVTAEVTPGTGINDAEVLAMSGYADDADFSLRG